MLTQLYPKYPSPDRIEQEFKNIATNANFAFVNDDIHLSSQNGIYFHGDNPSLGELSTDGFSVRYNGTNLLVEPFGSAGAIEYRDGVSVFYYSDGNDKSFKLSHDDTDGQLYVDVGDVVINPATGYVQFKSSKTTTGDPTGYEGRFYWNTIDNVAKLYMDSAWRTLVSW